MTHINKNHGRIFHYFFKLIVFGKFAVVVRKILYIYLGRKEINALRRNETLASRYINNYYLYS